jgi:galactokinase
MMDMHRQVIEAFEQRYQESPALVIRAPGRVNLIGEHTDYNDGFVLPMAIDRATWIALRPRTDRQVIVQLLNLGTDSAFDLDNLQREKASPIEYIKGVAWAMQSAGYTLNGWEGVLVGDVPIGAGLSSSAALELASARAFAAVSGIAWDAPKMARLSQKAENEWVGMNCGIMDQMISAVGRDQHALLIDCRSLESELLPLPPDTVIAVLDTTTRRGLVDGAYNERRQQCESAAQFFGVTALRDVSIDEFEARAAELDPLIRRRARHVVYENDRTLRAIEAMLAGDPVELGLLMNASHESLRDDFEVSSEALNQIVDCARQHEACYGARMTGGGFGGCAVALVRQDAAESFGDHVTACYREVAQLDTNIYICSASDGANIIS